MAEAQNLEAFSLAIHSIQALRSSVTRVFECLKDGMKNKESQEVRERAFLNEFQENLDCVNRDLKYGHFPASAGAWGRGGAARNYKAHNALLASSISV